MTESSSSLYKKKSDSYDPSLQVDSVVQVSINGEPKYGLIRWIGNIEKVNSTDLIAGLELVSVTNVLKCFLTFPDFVLPTDMIFHLPLSPYALYMY